MRPRPPSFRTKKRYLLVQILPPWRTVEARTLGSAVHEAAGALWGDAKTALIQPTVIQVDDGLLILRCRRGMEQDLITALATVYAAGDMPLTLRPLAVSGTLLALKRRGASLRQAVQEEDYIIKEHAYRAYRYQGHKIDLIERGNKGQNVVFFTEDDIEEL